MKCKVFNCSADATHMIVRASNMPVCDEHLLRNTLMFGCLLTTTPVAKEKGPAETGPKGSNTQEMALTHGTIL